MLNVYSRTRDGETLLSRGFRAKEFACKDGTDPLFVDSELVQVLQAIRDHFGAPVVITSGYRTAAHNRAVGGAVYSQHQYGRAADIRVSGVPVEQLAAYDPAARHRRHRPLPRKRLCPCGCAQSKKPVGRVKAVNGMETILSAVIAGAVTLIGVLIANSRSQAVTDTKLEELTREVREHNNFARRVPILEEQMKVANHRIADLEQNEKVRN